MSPVPPITTIFIFESPVLFTLFGRNECWNTLFFHQEHDELCRFAVARIAADDVNVIRTFIERFAGFERDGLGASQLHHDGTLEHVDEGVRIVPVDYVSAARRVGDQKHETFFSGNVREGFGHDFLHVGRWSGWSELRGERTSSDCDRQDELFHWRPTRFAFPLKPEWYPYHKGTAQSHGVFAPGSKRRVRTMKLNRASRKGRKGTQRTKKGG